MAGAVVTMPKLGLTMTEGVLSEWKVAPGDPVAAGDVLFVVETDKIANEVEATGAGVVEALLVAEGETVPVGATVALLQGAAMDAAPAIRSEAAPLAPAISATPAPVASARIVATPLARRIARRAGVDLAGVVGSGPRGRIMAEDVSGSHATVTPGFEPPRPSAAPVAAIQAPATGDIIPLGAFQAVTARRLTESKREIPHFYIFAEADVTFLLDMRLRFNAETGRTKLTVNHFLIAAMARALAAMPDMNRVWVGEGLRALGSVDVGMAVESPKGLLAPVLRDLGAATLDEVAAAATDLVGRARNGRLGGGELSGGATTISNIGMFGATALLPIINPGQSSILGVGRSVAQFRPDANGQPKLCDVLQLSLSCDHRVIDGALAARFLHSVQALLEEPLSLLRGPLPGVAP
jgi:pyruvate dehydrogenase E2 component (dihydrolipoamide acetyltransferase)